MSPLSWAFLPTVPAGGVTVELIMKKLRIIVNVTADEGYHDAVRTTARKP